MGQKDCPFVLLRSVSVLDLSSSSLLLNLFKMAVHRLFPVSSTSASSASPTALRRSARLGSPCPVVTRKRARVSDSSEQPQLPSKLSLTPEPSPRSIRAQKRQKILDNSSSIETTKGKRKVADEPYQVVKKRKENIINDVLRPTTRKRAANNVCSFFYFLFSFDLDNTLSPNQCQM